MMSILLPQRGAYLPAPVTAGRREAGSQAGDVDTSGHLLAPPTTGSRETRGQDDVDTSSSARRSRPAAERLVVRVERLVVAVVVAPDISQQQVLGDSRRSRQGCCKRTCSVRKEADVISERKEKADRMSETVSEQGP